MKTAGCFDRVRGCGRRLAACAAIAAGTVVPALAHDPGDYVSKQLVLEMEPGYSPYSVIDTRKVFVKASYPARSLYLLEARPGYEDQLEDLEDEYRHHDKVDDCDPNEYNGSVEGSTQSFFVRIPPPPDFVKQPAAAKLGLASAHAYADGSGVIVAVLDTGLTPHSYLAGSILPGYDWLHGVADTSDAPDGVDQDQDGFIDEMAGHGTFIAGIIHTAAPGARILPVKVLDSDGLGTSFALASGIYYAIDRGAHVINISLGSPVEADAVEDAVEEALERGIVVVAAVGNTDMAAPSYPAATEGVIGVAALDLADRKTPFSDYGPHVSLCAPGVGIQSILPGEDEARADGTSFSAAFVSGAAALVISKYPWLTPAQVKTRLMAQAVNVDAMNPQQAGQLGAGRVTNWGVMVTNRAGPRVQAK